MSALSSLTLYGRTCFKRSSPEPLLQRSMHDVDVLNESWQAATEDAFVEGQAHPGRPGMIIDMVRVTENAPGRIYTHAITSLGDSKGTKPTKIISRSSKRTVKAGWDEQVLEYLSWHCDWKACTAVASTDVLTCNAHGFAAGQRVVFRGLTGGAGITPASASARGVTYFVIDPTVHTFKISATLGGSALNITTDMSVGIVCAAEFVKGAAHPEYPNMFLVDIDVADDNTAWKRARCTYHGMMESKLYYRTITCNGQEVAPSDLLTVAFTDGFTSKHGSVEMPKIVCTDIYLTTTAPATAEIPSSQGEGATPPDAPSIRSIVISAGVEQLTYHWPNGWSRKSVGTLDHIPAAGVYLVQIVSEYVWPITFR